MFTRKQIKKLEQQKQEILNLKAEVEKDIHLLALMRIMIAHIQQ